MAVIKGCSYIQLKEYVTSKFFLSRVIAFCFINALACLICISMTLLDVLETDEGVLQANALHCTFVCKYFILRIKRKYRRLLYCVEISQSNTIIITTV